MANRRVDDRVKQLRGTWRRDRQEPKPMPAEPAREPVVQVEAGTAVEKLPARKRRKGRPWVWHGE
jgi:hypothetical protein